MSDDLIVSGGGSTTVAVDELFVDATRLALTESITNDWVARIGVIRRGLRSESFFERESQWPADPASTLARAGDILAHAHRRAGRLRTSLLESAERYGTTERFVDGLWGFGAAMGAPWLGFMAPGLVLGAVLAGLGQAAGSAGFRALGWGPTPLESWLTEHVGVLSDADFVRMVGLSADHADEFAAGALHLPVPAGLLSLLGSHIGAPENAAVLMAIVGALGGGVLLGAPVRVERADVRGVAPPAGLGQVADRVPSARPDAPAQIAIERYGEPGDRRWIVYVGGTVELGIPPGEQPMDMGSNVQGVADDSSLEAVRSLSVASGAGERAVREAMAEAGVRPDDPLLVVGYSGGGVIAAELAADPELNAVGAVNLGGPVATAPVRENVPLLSIEHEEDLVPATGGRGHSADERVVVSRSVLDADARYTSVLPAHELSRYRETAALADESKEERLVRMHRLVGEVTGGLDGERSEWIATRVLSPSTDAR